MPSLSLNDRRLSLCTQFYFRNAITIDTVQYHEFTIHVLYCIFLPFE